jgi:hypothetical protein
VEVVPPRLAQGRALTLAAVVLAHEKPVSPTRMTASVVSPVASLATVLAKHRDDLRGVKPPRDLSPDTLPSDIAKMATIRRQLTKAGKPDPFGTTTTPLKLRAVANSRIRGLGLGGLAPEALAAGLSTGVMVGQYDSTAEPGTYNLIVRATGVEPASGARFTRQELVSVLVS